MPGAVAQGLIWGIMAIGVFLTYKVLDSGSADPKISWEIVTDTNNNAMVVNGEPVSEFKIEEEYK